MKPRPLEILGISESVERAYRWLLMHPGATANDMALALRLSPRKTQQLLDTIEMKGLATHSPERPRRYLPSSPDVAVEALVHHRHEELDRARREVPDLLQQVRRPSRNSLQPVELIGHEVQRQTFEQIQLTAQQEIFTLVRPPMLISRLDAPHEQEQLTQRQALARGVCCRSIVNPEFLALPGGMARFRTDMRAGEGFRLSPNLPFKMVLCDRRIALIPLNLEQSGSPTLLVRSSALLEALCALFDLLWEKAVPLSLSNDGELETGANDSRLSEDDERLASLLATGINDKALANELDVSTRTLERRVTQLMQHLGTRTRFQTGWLAAFYISGSKNAIQLKSRVDHQADNATPPKARLKP